nr:reverse transcriptase domain-containing protein [Tanacetum cinerariifolium]
MRTRSSSNLPFVSPSNPSTSNPKRRNHRRSKQPFILEESPIDTMADQRTIAELLCASTEGYAETIVVPPILAEQFELKHSLINMMTLDRFFKLEKDNPHDHIWAARQWLEKEPSRSIHTWEDLVSKFINEFFPPQEQQISIAKLTHAVSQQTSDVTTAMTAILKQFQATPPPASVKAIEENCVTCGGAQLYYQYLAAGGNTFPELRDNIQGYVAAAVINYNQEQSYQASTQQNQIVPLNELEKVKRMNEANMKAMQTQINIVKNELRNEMKNLIQASLSNQTNEIKNMMASLFQMNIASTSGSGSLPSNTVANPKGKLKAITIRSSLILDGPTVPTPLPFINLEVDERGEDTLTDSDLSKDPLHLNIPYPLRMLKQKHQEKDEVQIPKFWQMFKQLHINIALADALILMPKYQKMLKALLSNKEKLQELANTPLNENCSAVILKKLLKKLGDPGKFLIPCGFSELKCKALADLGASINLMPLSVWKKLGLPNLISTCMTLELATRAICTPARIARDVFVPVGKFTFPADFIIVDYESDPRVPLILGRPFLRTAHALIDVHGEEMILRDGDERLTLNMRQDNSSYSNQPQKESINLINVFNNSKGGNVLPEKLLDLDFTKYLHPPLHVNPLSGSTTYSSSPSQLLEEFADELSLITFPLEYDDDLQFDIESNFKEIEYLLHHDPIKDIDSSLKDSIDQSNLAGLDNNPVDSMPEMFPDEHALDYSSPPIFDEYDDDLFKFDTKNVYDDPFDPKG